MRKSSKLLSISVLSFCAAQVFATDIKTPRPLNLEYRNVVDFSNSPSALCSAIADAKMVSIDVKVSVEKNTRTYTTKSIYEPINSNTPLLSYRTALTSRITHEHDIDSYITTGTISVVAENKETSYPYFATGYRLRPTDSYHGVFSVEGLCKGEIDSSLQSNMTNPM